VTQFETQRLLDYLRDMADSLALIAATLERIEERLPPVVYEEEPPFEGLSVVNH
jgi:hypothetical protein